MQYCDLGYVALFLPIVIILYFLTSKKHRYKILLGASFIFFYLLSKKLIIYLIFSGLSIHHFGLWLEHLKSLKKEEDTGRLSGHLPGHLPGHLSGHILGHHAAVPY